MISLESETQRQSTISEWLLLSYLKAMQDRFGYPALFAAYNAGPGRYADHLRTGKPLPAETRDYVARIAEILADAGGFALQGTNLPPPGMRNPDQISSGQRLFFSLSKTKNEAAGDEKSLLNGALFVPLSTRKPDE